MSIEILTPVLPESVSDGTIVSWNKKVGDAVQIDDILVEIETDKVVLEVPALSAGVLTEITVGEGAVVSSSQLLGRMDSAADAATSTTDTAAMSAAPVAASADTHAAMEASAQGDMMDLLTPVMPESVADGTVVSWNKRVGDTVQSDEILVEIETDKVVLEVPSLSAGVLTEIIAAEGTTVTSNELLGRIRTGAASSAASQQSQSQAPAMSAPAASDASSMSAPPAAGPAARKMMAENNLDRSQVSGSGKSGRILKEDVQAVVNNSAGSESPSSAPMTAAATPSPASSAMSASGERTDERVPMSRLRKRVAERLLDAKQSTAMLTTFNEVDMQPLMNLRKEYKERFEKQHQVKLGFMSLFVKASAIALQRFPEINAFIEGEDIVYHNYCDIGIAVSSERGLVVPVLRNAEQMGLADVEKNIMTYAQKAQEGKLDMADLTGGTFTITNGGVFGSLLSTPIINMPQSAILGMHATQKRAVVVNDEIVIRPMMYVALSYDHRIVDGKGAVTFLKTIKELVENPVRIILDV